MALGALLLVDAGPPSLRRWREPCASDSPRGQARLEVEERVRSLRGCRAGSTRLLSIAPLSPARAAPQPAASISRNGVFTGPPRAAGRAQSLEPMASRDHSGRRRRPLAVDARFRAARSGKQRLVGEVIQLSAYRQDACRTAKVARNEASHLLRQTERAARQNRRYRLAAERRRRRSGKRS